jgi:hypothetical protein
VLAGGVEADTQEACDLLVTVPEPDKFKNRDFPWG